MLENLSIGINLHTHFPIDSVNMDVLLKIIGLNLPLPKRKNEIGNFENFFSFLGLITEDPFF